MRNPIRTYFAAYADDPHQNPKWWWLGFHTKKYSARCGHKHKTVEGAEKCRSRMEKLYHQMRYGKRETSRA